ncbi:MAG: O-antigen ligase family protein [Clostridia bacterium]|nr:O-antigen ligase family protein [Clostridia bacterium]
MNLLMICVGIVLIILFFVLLIFKRNYLSLYVLIIWIFLPKINIITPIANVTTGIRIEDIIILIFCFVLLFEKFKSCKSLFKSKLMLICYAYLGASFISFLWGILGGLTISPLASILGLVRKVEYFCFILVGADFIYFNKTNYLEIFKQVIDISLLYIFILCILQYSKLIGGFLIGEYSPVVTYATAQFNGAYELGAYCNLILPLYIYSVIKSKSWQDKILNSCFIFFNFVAVALTMSRTPIAINILITFLMIFVFSNKKFKIIEAVGCITFVCLLFVLIKYQAFSFLQRFNSLNLHEIFNSISYNIQNVTYDDYYKNLYEGQPYSLYGGGDVSFNMRMFKWAAMLNVFLSFPIFGYGFGSNVTIDGNYIKMLAENGLVGLVLFICIFVRIFLMTKGRKDLLNVLVIFTSITILLGAVFIDMFESSKVMSLFWFIIGIFLFKYISQPENKSENNDNITGLGNLTIKNNREIIKTTKRRK